MLEEDRAGFVSIARAAARFQVDGQEPDRRAAARPNDHVDPGAKVEVAGLDGGEVCQPIKRDALADGEAGPLRVDRGPCHATARPLAVRTHAVFDDDRYDYGERRRRAYGVIDGQTYYLAYVVRDDRIRAISLRRAHAKEFKRYVP